MRTVFNLDDAKATLLIEQGASVAEVAERLSVSRQAVNHAIRRGRIPRPHPGGPLGDRMPQDGTHAPGACAGTALRQEGES